MHQRQSNDSFNPCSLLIELEAKMTTATRLLRKAHEKEE
jgi:hypothetical protein